MKDPRAKILERLVMLHHHLLGDQNGVGPVGLFEPQPCRASALSRPVARQISLFGTKGGDGVELGGTLGRVRAEHDTQTH